MRADLELIAGFFVNVGATQNGEFFDLIWKWDRSTNRSACALGCANDFLCACIKHPVIKRLKADTDVLALSGHEHHPFE